MKLSTPRALTAALASLAIVVGVLPAGVALAAPGDPTTFSGTLTPQGAANTNTSVVVTATNSSHTQAGGVPPVIMYLTGPQTQPGTDPSNGNAPYPAQKVVATGVTVTGTTVATVTGTFNFVTANQPAGPGLWDLTICYAATATSTSCSNSTPNPEWEVGRSIFTVFAPTPDITAFSPTSRAAGGKLQESVQGINIGRGGTLDVLRDNAAVPGFTFTNYAYLAGQTVTADLAIDPGVIPRTYDLRYTNTDGKSDVIPGGLTVTPAITLGVTPISPTGATRGVVNYPFTIDGGAFQQGANVYAQDPAVTTGTDAAKGAGVAFSIASITPTTITGTVSITDTATTTVARNLVVVNPDGSRASAPGAFTLYPAPTVGTPSPASRGRGAKSDITVNGTNFRLVGTSGVPLVDFGADTTHGPVEYISPTQLLVRAVSIGQAASLGTRAVRVSNADGAYVSSSSSAFTINAGPLATTITPTHFGRGGTVPFTIDGSGFGTTANDITVSVVDPATNVAVCTSPPTTGTNSGNRVTASCTLPSTISTGQYAVRIDKASDGGSSTCANTCFTVDAFQVSGVTIPGGGLGNNEPRAVPITVTGGGLPSDGYISFRHNPSLFDQGEILAVACPSTDTCGVSSDGTSVKQYFVFNNVAPGKYDVLVTGTVTGNPATGQCSCQINVFAAGAPAVTTITPTTFVQGATERLVTVTGTNLYKGDRAVISGGDGKVTVVPGSESVAADHLSMTFKVSVDPAAATPGSNVVKISDSSAPAANSATTALTITKRPTITSVAPTAIGRGGVTPADGFTIKGQNFVLDADPNKATKVSFCDGVTATGLKIVKGTAPADDTATMTLAVAGDAPLGSCTVTVTNPDAGVGTAPLTITEAPVTTRLSPSGLAKGRNAVDVALSGTGYVTGATVSFLKGGTADPKITVNSVTFGTSGQITANITTAADAATGVRDVVVTNPDLGSYTCVGCFAIAVVPGAPVSVKPRVGDGRAQVIWTKPLSDGGAAISSYVVTVNPGGRQIPVASGSATSVMVNGLTNGTAYTFSVKASNVVGSGPATASDKQTPAPMTRLLSVKPAQIVNTASGLGLGNIAGKVSNRQFDVPFANVPAEATGAVVSIHVKDANATTYVKAYGTGTPFAGSVVYGLPGINHSATQFITLGSAKSLHVSVVGGPVHLVINHVGWLVRVDQDGAAASTLGGRFVPANKVLINYRMSSAGPLPSVNPGFYYDFGSSLPDVDAVALQISTSNSRSGGTVSAYSPDDGQIAMSHAFTRSRSATTFAIARVSKVPTPDPSDAPGKMTNRLLLKVNGTTGLLVTMVGYWSKDNSAFAGHGITLAQSRILATPSPRPGEITVKVPASVPGTVTGVLLSVTAFDTAGSTVVRAYPDGGAVPAAYTVSYTARDKASNIAIVGVGDNRYIRIKVYGASTKLYVDVLGYLN